MKPTIYKDLCCRTGKCSKGKLVLTELVTLALAIVCTKYVIH